MTTPASMEYSTLPKRVRRGLEQELEPNEGIRWVEQPIPRLFNRSTVGICGSLLVPIVVFSFAAFNVYSQIKPLNKSLYELLRGVDFLVFGLVFGASIFVPLALIVIVPVLSWLEARQTVYVITDKRAFSLTVGRSLTVTSFVTSELRVLLRREHRDGSGDVIVYIHRSTDGEGDVQTQEIGFRQLRHPKAFEQALRLR